MDLLNTHQRYMLDKRDKNGRRVYVYKLGNTKSDTTIQMSAQIDDIWFECMLIEHETQLNGLSIIADFKDIPWTSLKWLHPKHVRIAADKSDVLPCKNLYIHIVNTSALLSTIMKTVNPFLSKRMKAKVRPVFP